MTCLTMSETKEHNSFDSYSETTTPFLANKIIEQMPWGMSRRALKNAGLKFANPKFKLKSNVSIMSEPNGSYSDLEDVNDSEVCFLGTINELIKIASQGWVVCLDDYGESTSPNIQDLERKFVNLKEKWYADTLFCSSITLMQEHPAYLEIVSMGVGVIPFILRELEKGSGYWFVALKAITGHDPVDIKDRGRVKKMTQSWLLWGKEQGYGW